MRGAFSTMATAAVATLVVASIGACSGGDTANRRTGSSMDTTMNRSSQTAGNVTDTSMARPGTDTSMGRMRDTTRSRTGTPR